MNYIVYYTGYLSLCVYGYLTIANHDLEYIKQIRNRMVFTVFGLLYHLHIESLKPLYSSPSLIVILQPKMILLTLMPSSQMYMAFFLQMNTNKDF